jgi:hypothetical protein
MTSKNSPQDFYFNSLDWFFRIMSTLLTAEKTPGNAEKKMVNNET